MTTDPTTATADAIYNVIRLLRPLVLRVARSQDAHLEERGLTQGSRAVMEILAEEGPQAVPEIARRWTLGRQNVQRLVDSLVGLALIERVENPGHRRSPRICLTPAGVATFRELRDREQQMIAQLTTGLARSDVETCRRVLLHLDAGLRFSGPGRASNDAARAQRRDE